ncbi:MAG: MBL fold metallo-hydrolase [Candidatus Thorarchaeota archaeon]
MIVEKIGSRGVLISFSDPYFTNVYIIFGDEHVFVLDTFLGNKSMKIVHHLIENEGYIDMPVVIFNSHADYDHYWGNGSFKDASIVGHEHCRERVLLEGESSLLKYEKHRKGKVKLLPPTQTFQKTLRFEDDEVLFFHTPGHTLDSSSCFDEIDKVLFVGDNIESPIPYLNHANFDQYIQTLESYLKLNWNLIIAGHDPPLKKSDLINQNMDYLYSLKNWNIKMDSMSKDELYRHVEQNLVAIKDELMRSVYKERFLKHLAELEKLRGY